MLKTIAQWLRRGVARTMAVLGLPLVADQTNYFDAEKSVFKLNDGSSLRDLSPYVKELRGLPGQFKVNDITTFGSVGERPGPSIYVNHFTVEFLFNMVTSVGVHTVLATMHSAKASEGVRVLPRRFRTAGQRQVLRERLLPRLRDSQQGRRLRAGPR